MAPRIVLDVSTSLAWRRPPVGIVRAEQKFAAFLLQRANVDVSFCRFDAGARRYFAVAPVTVGSCLASHDGGERLAARGPLGSRRPGPSPAPLGRRMRGSVAKAVGRGIARLPPALRTDASLVVRGGETLLKGLYWLALGTGRQVLGRRESRVDRTGDSEMHLGPNDVYVAMGLDWQYNDLKVLQEEKRRRGFRTLLHCYDLIPVRFPELMGSDSRDRFAKYFVDVARVADRVVAISRSTLDDYHDYLEAVGVPVPPLSVVHLGTDIAAREAGPGTAPSGLPEGPFVLCVGTLEPRKNHELLYNLWDRLVARHGERVPRLVLAGMLGWGVDDLLARIRRHRALAEKIVVLHDVPDRGLLWLYEHSLFTVYPALHEGWGLPVVESLALGKPCLTSNAPALLEATRGLVPTLDPRDFQAWLDHVECWMFDRQALEEAARRLVDYHAESWRDHGEAMLDVIARTSGDSRRAAST